MKVAPYIQKLSNRAHPKYPELEAKLLEWFQNARAQQKTAWKAIDINMIRKFFKCCEIANAIDKTEDNLIFDFTRIMNQTNPEREIKSQEELDNNENNDDNDGENNDDNDGENNGENDAENDDENDNKNDSKNDSDDDSKNNGEREENKSINENESGLVFDNYYEEG
ncbi:5839_t:CDS:2 [Racocetra persica]|uniref:5839_t:CDS:1 n=1 Tax=Racocetra persica TaxID=160502 RepID=A0ACA9LW07_9GLOM|nr:5839_t:CDS:2 [Racocetra persica]